MKSKVKRRRVLAGIGATALVPRPPANVFGDSLRRSSSATALGYSVVVQLFGTGATYNKDGTVTGAPNGTRYTYDPDAPDSHTTATVQDNFISDFAGFVQGSIHVTRDDTALRVYFRKDVSPNPSHIEIILELGHFTTGGKAANLGPFSLQILKAGVPQNIAVNTVAAAGNTWVAGGASFTGTKQVTTAYFPSLGWFTRWRWNPTPRPVIRNNTQLLPANLNLVPNYSSALAAKYHCIDCGQPGGLTTITAYSSAWNPMKAMPGQWSNYNPTGVNEATALTYPMETTGARPDIGLFPEWHANWCSNGNGNALKAMLVLAEVDGGIPWMCRDVLTGAPPNLITSPGLNYTAAIDRPNVVVPSAGAAWDVEVNHHPCLSYVPYLITGDPYYLENLQMVAGFCLLFATGGRDGYVRANLADPNSVIVPGYPQPTFATWRTQSRSLAWIIRTYVAVYLATPASVPSWLLPKGYWLSVLNTNAGFGVTYGVNEASSYPSLAVVGEMPGANSYEEGFMLAFLMKALGFAVNQGGLSSSWGSYYSYASKMFIDWAAGNGTTGWAPQLMTPYTIATSPYSTDYIAAPSEWATAQDFWNYHLNSGILPMTSQYENMTSWGYWGGQTLVFASKFPQWSAGASFKCNSWVVDLRAGCPVVLNAGDTCSLTISGSFAGSPVTISYKVTAGDVTSLVNIAVEFLTSGGSSTTNPVIQSFVNQINAHAALHPAGITAAHANTVPNAGNQGSGAVQYQQDAGRLYLSFNGAAVGPITVTGGVATTSGCDLYIQPNGDGCSVGTGGPGGRPLNYQAASNFTTAAGNAPTGTALQTVITTGDGSKWCFAPERKMCAFSRPGVGAGLAAFPKLGFGGAYGNAGYHNYLPEFWSSYAYLQTAGISGATTARSQATAALNELYRETPGSASVFGFCVAP
jgi:hypothetical protein